MTVTRLSAAVGLIVAIAGAMVGAQQYVQAQVAEAKQEADEAVAFQNRSHRLDVYESKREQAELELDILRRVGAENHELEAAESELEFWRAQVLKAREKVTE